MSAVPSGHYALAPHQVPDFPTSDRWLDHLRWCVAVMDTDDDDVGFAASLLSHVVTNGGITEKQVKYAKRIVERVRALWLVQQLGCQQSPKARQTTRLSLIQTEGKTQ